MGLGAGSREPGGGLRCRLPFMSGRCCLRPGTRDRAASNTRLPSRSDVRRHRRASAGACGQPGPSRHTGPRSVHGGEERRKRGVRPSREAVKLTCRACRPSGALGDGGIGVDRGLTCRDSIAPWSCCRRGYYWDYRVDSCSRVYSTGGSDNSRGSCSGYPSGQGGYGFHCDATGGREFGSGFMPIGGWFGDDGPGATFGGSFLEWLLWNQDRSSSGE